MAIIKAKSDVKERLKTEKLKEMQVSQEAQRRLAQILSDAPTIEKLNGTEWEIRALRNGTQYLIVEEVCKVNNVEDASYGDVLHVLMSSMQATYKVLTLALLNDKYKIYKDGNPSMGFSDLYKQTYDTVVWSLSKEECGIILLDCLKLIDVSFFMEALGMLQIFRASVTEKKRTRKKTDEPKLSARSAKSEI